MSFGAITWSALEARDVAPYERTMALDPRYDAIGQGYARFRREDPRLAARIRAALGGARSVVNVGAGSGSYEPADLHVLAVEPSDVMAAQRPQERAPAIRATAGALPLRDASVDAAMAVLSLHHWDANREAGVRELRRVARGPVVLLTFDAEVSGAMWLMAEYLTEVAELESAHIPFPTRPRSMAGWSRLDRSRAHSARYSGLDPRLLLGTPRACARCRGEGGHVRVRPHAGARRRSRRARRGS